MKLSSDISAVITGGASGLGEATARGLAAKGVKVGIFDMNEERGEAVAKDIGGVFAKVNVADNDSVDAGFALSSTRRPLRRRMGRLAKSLMRVLRAVFSLWRSPWRETWPAKVFA